MDLVLNNLQRLICHKTQPTNPLSNRFSPMDIDPVETTTEDSDETTTHIKTDTINLQKWLFKKNKY